MKFIQLLNAWLSASEGEGRARYWDMRGSRLGVVLRLGFNTRNGYSSALKVITEVELDSLVDPLIPVKQAIEQAEKAEASYWNRSVFTED